MNNSNNPNHYNNDNDFLNDEGFINFHFKLNARDEFFWNNWITTHPDKIELVNEARGLLNMLSFTLPDDEYNTELEKIKQAIDKRQSEKNSQGVFRLLQWNSSISRSRKIVAAVVLAIIVSSYFLFNFFSSSGSDLREHYNNTKNDVAIKLEDNSQVKLSPGSRLTYHLFKTNRRDVYLQGSGSFKYQEIQMLRLKYTQAELLQRCWEPLLKLKAIVKIHLLKLSLKQAV